ncbi:MAG: hypothetical protein ACTSWE_03295 [Promethearchaeota archaeon]
MLIENTETTRFIGVYVTQLGIGIIFLYVTYRLLRRNRSMLSLLLGLFFFLQSMSLILLAILYPIRSNPFSYNFYFISLYINLSAQIFVVLFFIKLFHFENMNFTWKEVLIIIFHLTTCFLIFYFSNGIKYDETTNWSPKYSFLFFTLLSLYFTCVLLIPAMLYSIKLYKVFSDAQLKKRYKYFLIGMLSYGISFYGVLIFNTFDNYLFKAIWIIISLFLIPFELLLFYGIGTEL